MADAALPTQSAIDEARQILQAARVRVGKIGDSLDNQVKDKELRDLTGFLYKRIPKVKPLGVAESSWLLTQGNILLWDADLDAYESALYATRRKDLTACRETSLTVAGEYMLSTCPKTSVTV